MSKQKKQSTQKPEPKLFDDRVFYGPRFLERLVGKKILNDPRTAVVELVANAWDAGASRVDIRWPSGDDAPVSVADNGVGMAESEFLNRWQTLAYDRLAEQGMTVKVVDFADEQPRRVYGRNGIGRFAAFCFGEIYEVKTAKHGFGVHYAVSTRGNNQKPFNIERLREPYKHAAHGTTVLIANPRPISIPPSDIETELAMRFLADPRFRITVNGKIVELQSIPNNNVNKEFIVVDGTNVEVIAIDTIAGDRTTRLHGIAFHVNGRLAGEVTWRHPGIEEPIDGRSVAGKRLLFIVRADILQDSGALSADWSQLDDTNPTYLELLSSLNGTINRHADRLNASEHEDDVSEARRESLPTLRRLEVKQVGKWTAFVREARAQCRTLRRADLVKLGTLLARLEASESKFALIHRLADNQPNQLDSLHEILTDWTVDTAKAVLDEIRTRVSLLAELRRKTIDEKTDEVQELQPLFEQGLWIFGPEFETIHFASNRWMNSVIRNLLKRPEVSGSANRPDFVVLVDGSACCYTYPRFGSIALGEEAEAGVERLVIVELKKPGVPISTDEKAQCWKYVKELTEKGLIDSDTKVDCYVLGSVIDPAEARPREENDGKCKIIPIHFDLILTRAESRLLQLDKLVRNAPFLRRAVDQFEKDAASVEEPPELFTKHAAK